MDVVVVVVVVVGMGTGTGTATTPLWRVEDLVVDSEVLPSTIPSPLTMIMTSHHWAKIDQSPAGWSLGSLLKLDYLVRDVVAVQNKKYKIIKKNHSTR